MGLFVSAQALAQLTGLSPPTIRLRCGGVPTRTVNRTLQYESKTALQTLLAPDVGDFEHHRTRSEKYRADLLEMELAKVREETLSREEIEKVWVSIAYTIRAKLLALPGVTAREVVSLHEEEEVERVLLVKIEEVLKELETASTEARGHFDSHNEVPGPNEEEDKQKENKTKRHPKGKKKVP